MVEPRTLVSRRQAMGILAGIGVGVVAAACGGGSSSSNRSSSSTTATSSGATGSTTTATCVLTPEVTEGPYYVDLNNVRSDITEGKDGAPLDLKITVVDRHGLHEDALYSSHGTRDVRNSADNIYRSAGAASAVLAVTPQDRGYSGQITVGVKRS